MAAVIPKAVLEYGFGAHLAACVQCVEVYVGDTPTQLPCDVGKHLAAALELTPVIAPLEPPAPPEP